MGQTFTGSLTAPDGRLAIVVSRFNDLVTKKLLDGAVDTLQRHGVDDVNIDVAWVPGAFEMPPVARRLATCGRYQAVICLGCVIRGETAHFDYVAGEAARGIQSVSNDTGVPVVFGVLTTDTVEQAMQRAGVKSGNKGADAALTAIEMMNLIKELPTS